MSATSCYVCSQRDTGTPERWQTTPRPLALDAGTPHQFKAPRSLDRSSSDQDADPLASRLDASTPAYRWSPRELPGEPSCL